MIRLRLPAIAALVCSAIPVVAQGSILPYLPKNTIVAVSAPDLAKSLEEFQKMPLAKMWNEKETQNFLADAIALAKKKIEEGMAQAREMHAQGALPVNPDDLLKLELRGATFALTHLELQMGDFGPLPKIGIVLHLDFGASTPQWHALLTMGLGMLEGAAGPQVQKSEAKVGEWNVLSFVPQDASGIEMGLHVAMTPTGLLLGTLVDDVKNVAESIQKKAASLGDTPDYQAAAKHLGTDGAEIETFVRMDPLVQFGLEALKLGTAMSPELQQIDMAGIERAVQAMGLRGLGAGGATSNYVDGKAVQRAYHVYPATAGATAAPAKTVDTAFLKWVPKDAVGFSASTFDVVDVYDRVVKGLQAYDPEFATKTLARLAEMETQLGFKVRDDLIGSLGDHYVSWSMPMGTISSAPEVAFLLKVSDEAKLVGSLEKIAKLTNGMVEVEAVEKRGLKTYQIRINFDPTQGMGGMNFLEMFTPTFAFKNGYLVGGFSANDVKRVFQRMDREDDPKNDIRGNKEFAAVAASFPAGVSSLSFTDWKSQFESLYQIATGLLAFVPVGEEIPIDMSLLPDSATLTKHLFGSISYTKANADSTETISISPFGMEVGVLAAAAIGAAASVGVVAQRRF